MGGPGLARKATLHRNPMYYRENLIISSQIQNFRDNNSLPGPLRLWGALGWPERPHYIEILCIIVKIWTFLPKCKISAIIEPSWSTQAPHSVWKLCFFWLFLVFSMVLVWFWEGAFGFFVFFWFPCGFAIVKKGRPQEGFQYEICVCIFTP